MALAVTNLEKSSGLCAWTAWFWLDEHWTIRCIKGFIQKDVSSVKSLNCSQKLGGDTPPSLLFFHSEQNLVWWTPLTEHQNQGSLLLLKAAFSEGMMALAESSACKGTEMWREHDHALTSPDPSWRKKPQTVWYQIQSSRKLPCSKCSLTSSSIQLLSSLPFYCAEKVCRN